MTEVIDKEHAWFSPIDDAANDMAQYWIDALLAEDDDKIFEIIEDRAIEVGIAYANMERGDEEETKRHERFEYACVKRARIKLIGMLAQELEDMP